MPRIKTPTGLHQTKAPELVATDEQVAADNNATQENTAVRNNAVRIASQLNTTITTQNRGIIGGLYLKESGVIDDGRAVKWSCVGIANTTTIANRSVP
jgi:hypothetical protein